MTYEDLLLEADKNEIITREKPLQANLGRIKGNRIAIKKGMTETEKKCVMAEELGHYYTTVGNILDQSITDNRKQERRARIWAYENIMGLPEIVSAINNHCSSLLEMADFLEVTEEFLTDALEYYKSKYGLYATVNNYTIFFEPLCVLELYK